MIDVSELEAFARKCEAMQADLKPYAGKTLEEIGEEFLDIVQAQIQGAHNVDKGTLFGSFTKGGAGNIFQLDMGALTLTIGTDVYYAKWVNKVMDSNRAGLSRAYGKVRISGIFPVQRPEWY